MSRPIKTGLEYFSMDTEWDRKMKIFKAKYKLLGIGLITELWKVIYSEGYFYPWDEDSQVLFANEHGLDMKQVSEMVNFAIEKKIFDKRMYSKYQILTSPGIQKRYLNSCSKRIQVVFIKEYLLIEPKKSSRSPTEIIVESLNEIKESEKSETPVSGTEIPVSGAETPVSGAETQNPDLLIESKKKQKPKRLDTKIIIGAETPVSGTEIPVSGTKTQVSGNRSTQSKESKESKVNLPQESSFEDFVDDWKKKLKKQTHGEIAYPLEFETWWKKYPRRVDKKMTFKCWLDCLEAGATSEILLTAASNYKAACQKEGTTGRYIKHSSTFLGPGEPWRDYTQGSPDDEEESPTICPICDIELIGARPTCPVCFLPVDDFDNPEAVEEYKERLRDEQATSR